MPQETIVGRISPKLVKKVEKEILTEAKNEEKHLKRAIKDLTQVEKGENKAQKTVFKADHVLQNADKKEQRTLHDMYKAEHNHKIALSKSQEAQKELEASKAAHLKAKETLKQKSVFVEEAMKSHDDHVKIRNDKLAALRGTYGPQAVAELVSSEVNHTNEPTTDNTAVAQN